MLQNEPFRPQFHFSPARKWLNDPNGLVHYAGEYHLFYQYHPYSTVWGPMYWGHAVSANLVDWTELPIALQPDELGAVFSGSAVIDWRNTAGFGAEAMVAIFTHHADPGHRQSQGIAYSLDKGRSWTKYAGNPVLPNSDQRYDFRDPKVFWYGDDSGHWVMALATTAAILFFTSPNLIDWTPSGSFGNGFGSTEGVWETPDLFALPVEGTEERRWVLLVGVGGGAPAGGSGEQYFIGHFDGQTFTSENPKEMVLWADYGADAYAAQTWSDAPDDRRLAISWMNNWAYAREIPTGSWRGAMTLPRALSLAATAAGTRLRQEPVAELTALRGAGQRWTSQTIAQGKSVGLAPADGALWEILADFDFTAHTPTRFGLRLVWPGGECVAVGYDVQNGQLFTDRTKAGVNHFHQAFAAVHVAPLKAPSGKLRLHLFVDHSSIELFANDGIVTMTDRIFPAGGTVGLELFTEGDAVELVRLDAYPLHAATFTRPASAPSAAKRSS